MDRYPSRAMPPETQTIDIWEYVGVLRAKLIYILLAGVLAGLVGYYQAAYRTSPIYEASINLIVNADTEAAAVVSISEVHSAATLIDTYAVIIKSNRVLDAVIEQLGLPYSWPALNGKISVSSVNQTSVMRVAVRDANPDEAMRIVLKISEVAPDILVQAVRAGSCEIVSNAYCSGVPIAPNVQATTRKYLLVGLAGAAALFMGLHFLRNTVNSEDELADVTDLPVLGVIPDIEGFSRSQRKGKRK